MNNATSILATEEIASFLAGCCDEMYSVFGSGAGLMESVSLVVVSYEAARVFGERRTDFDALGAHRAAVAPRAARGPEIIGSTLTSSLRADTTGNFVLIVFVSLLAPRLLVSLRDAQALTGPASGPLRAAARRTSAELIEQMRVISAALMDSGADHEQWASELARTAHDLDTAGFGESFGLSR